MSKAKSGGLSKMFTFLVFTRKHYIFLQLIHKEEPIIYTKNNNLTRQRILNVLLNILKDFN